MVDGGQWVSTEVQLSQFREMFEEILVQGVEVVVCEAEGPHRRERLKLLGGVTTLEGKRKVEGKVIDKKL